MTKEEKVIYMTKACNICRINFNEELTDLIVSLYELILEKGGETDLHSIAKVQVECKNRADIKSRENLLDKVSKEV